MADELPRTPRSYTVLAVILFVIAGLLLAASWRLQPFAWTGPLLLAMAGAALSEVFSFELAGISLSLAYPLVMCVIVLCGPAASGLAVALTAVPVEDIRRRRPASILLFNIGQLVISSCTGGWVYLLLGGRVLQSPTGEMRPFVPSDFPAALYGMVGSALVYAVLNLALVSAGFGVYRHVPVWQVARSALPVLPAHVALPFVGFLMAQVLAINAWALPLFVFPLLVARQLYQRYLGLRSAYADTIRSLIGAIEAKDPYTRGHSERVAGYASALGLAMGLDSRANERLEYAALLHDLGKLAVPASILTKPGRLDSAEMKEIRLHPERGAQMVRRIPPLRDLADTVGQHHECVDGSGYPMGILGGQMSLAARILAVADCYDAMTTTRSYRPALSHDEALAELVGGAGTQFDEEVVRRFVQAELGQAVLLQTPRHIELVPAITVNEE